VICLAISVTVAIAGIDALTMLPLDHPAIDYEKSPAHNRAAALSEKLDSRQIGLSYDPEFGYLKSVLQALHVPASSQVLVFSKTSFQAPKIFPRMPRAIYHSADVMVGYVRGGDVLEIIAIDPRQGPVFYTLDQEKSPQPMMVRRAECIQCHYGPATLGVPGLLVRSVHVDRTGYALTTAPSFVTDHTSPLKQRWGGWYVTGTHGSQLHMGNQTVESRGAPELDLAKGANLTDLSHELDVAAYLQATSDIVSLMVLEHQSKMTNLLTRLGWEARMGADGAKLDEIAAEVANYMLFVNETPLESPIRGSERYASDFAGQGPKDRKGRSLRDLDMKTRMFRYPCSFLIYSEQFDALPQNAKDKLYRRLFATLTAQKRSDVIEILRDTKKDLPPYWNEHGREVAAPLPQRAGGG
jgi:hypothetical protein